MVLHMRKAVAAGMALAMGLAGGEAHALTLRDALIQAYNTNPTLTGARAQLRAIDENVAIAHAQGRPTFSGDVTFQQSFDGIGTFGSRGRQLQATTSLGLPIFQGGAVRNAIKAADSRVEAGRDDLRGVEADLFAEAVGAYMDVIRDQSIVSLNENQVKVLETNLQASRDRFEVGDLTRTDVAQSEARLSGARSQLAVAVGNLTASRENFRRVIGLEPTDLQAPPPLPILPDNPDRATEVALENNPQLASIAATAKANGFDVGTARADLLPKVSVFAGTSYLNYLNTLEQATGLPGIAGDQVVKTSSVGARLTVPLYQGGLVAARVRQARALEAQAMEQMVLVERSVVARARSSFASFRASNEAITANQIAVQANELALEGARAENSVGTRTVIEVLNAEQELLNSRVALVTAERDRYVAGFALLNAMGQAELRDLNLENTGPLYDPTLNYNRVSKKAWDFALGHDPKTEATRTVDLPSPVAGPQQPR